MEKTGSQESPKLNKSKKITTFLAAKSGYRVPVFLNLHFFHGFSDRTAGEFAIMCIVFLFRFNTAGSTWMIIPVSKWLVTPIYKPFKPFGRGRTLLRDLLTMVINHLQVLG